MDLKVDRSEKFKPITVNLVLNSVEDLVKLYSAASLLVRDAYLPIGFVQEKELGMCEELLNGTLRDILADMLEDTEYKDSIWEKGGRKPTKSKKG